MEVVANDFVMIGCGETWQDAVNDHDQNLRAFLQRCVAKGLKLNSHKVKL